MLTATPVRSSPPIDRATADALSRPPEPPHTMSREQIAARVASCRSCAHAAPGSASCEACALRCSHPHAKPNAQLIACRASICPANLWSVLT